MVSRLVFLLFCGNIALNLGNAQKLPRVKRQSLKVQINATSDAVCMRYIRPSPSTKLEGFILGYGSSFFSNQYILLPSDGKSYITEVDAEPRYLIAVRPARVSNYKKSCSGQMKTPKPLQLVIGTLSPTSVFLSWGILVNPKHDWTTMKNCANDRFYTVRYREKDKNKKWVLQLCPTTETVVDNLKPNTIYEFGVKDNTDNGIWSKIFSHKVAVSNKIKENGELQNNYKLPKIHTQLTPGDSKALVPITIIKQVIQNITHRTHSKTPEKSPLAGPILDFNRTQQKLPAPLSLDIPERPKKAPEWPAESKTPEVQKLPPQLQPAMTELDWESNTPTVSSVSEEVEGFPAHTESELDSSKPSITPMAELPLDTLAPHKVPELPKTKTTSSILQMPMETLDNASSEIQPVPSQSQTPAPKTAETKPGRLNDENYSVGRRTSHACCAHESGTTFSKTEPALSSPRTSDKTDISDSKPAVTYEPAPEFLLPKTTKPLDWPRATLAPSETPLIPFKWKLTATPEGWHMKLAPNSPPLEQNTPKMPRITEQFKTTPALPETKFVPSTPKPSTRPKIPEAKPEKELQWESPTPKIDKKPELPRSTLAPSKTKIPVSQMLPHLEEPKIVPAVTSRLVPAPVPTKISQTAGHPLGTLASYEPTSIPSKSKEFDSTMPETPDSKPASTETDNFSSKTSSTPEPPLTTSAPKAKHPLSSPKTTGSPHVLHSEPVLKPILFRTEPPKTEMEKDGVPSKPKTLLSPDVPKTTKPDIDMVAFRTEQPRTTIATKGARRVPVKPKTSSTPGITTTKPSPKGSRRVPSKPKTSPSPHVPQTKPAPKKTQLVLSKSKTSLSTGILQAGLATTVEQFIPNKSKTSTRPRILETKPAVHQTTSQPFIIKPTISSEPPKATTVPKERRVIPSKPKTSGKPQIPQTKPAPIATYPGSIHLHIHVLNGSKDIWASSKPQSGLTATESPHLKTAPHKVHLVTAKPKARPVVNKTTPAPSRTRTPGLTWSKVSRGDKLTDQDSARLLSTSSSISLDSTGARKKPAPVATPPDSPRASLAPAKPTPMRRKPLPPNTVTGKPGSSENILMPRAPSFPTASSIAKTTGPATFMKTSSPKKPPTASSSPDYSNTTLFSSHPTTETDIAGKQRFTGEHVKYMKKDEDVPCSITDTLQHFPTDDGENKEMAISPPQNPPTNLTVVTVEGCPSFVILDWEKPKNDTVTEYKVVSTENGAPDGKNKCVTTTNQTHSTVENLKPNTSYEFFVIPSNPLGEGPSSEPKPFKTESADPRVNEPISMGKDAIWTEIKFNSDTYSECKGKQYVKRTWYKKFVGVQLCNSLRYKIYLSDSLTGKFYNIGDQRGHGEDHCQFVDSYLDGRTGQQIQSDQLPTIDGFFRAVRQEPVQFGKIGAETHTNYVHWYECGTTVPGKW